MFNNDHDKKYAVFAVLVSLTLLVLASCGKQAREISGSAHDIAHMVYMTANGEDGALSEEDVGKDRSYLLFLSQEDFEKVEEAKIFTASGLAAWKSFAVIVAKDESAAEMLHARISREFDWAPCDPADEVAFMHFGRYVIMAKDEHDGIAKLCSAFDTVCGEKTNIDHSYNPM